MDRPIIFSAPMVRALLDGRKTQTRRVLNPQPFAPHFAHFKDGRIEYTATMDGKGKTVPYASGDRLYVREAWRAERGQDRQNATEIAAACLDAGYSRVWCPTFYEVDAERVNFKNGMVAGRYRQARFMPRWASRITLTVTEVRVQRLQEISEADARAEGAPALGAELCPPDCEDIRSHVWGFHELWNSLHGPDAWDANPWVVAVTFSTERRNIDAI